MDSLQKDQERKGELRFFSHITSWLKKECQGSFLVAQWLGLYTLTAMAWVQSLVRELRSHKLHSRKKECQNQMWSLLLGWALCARLAQKSCSFLPSLNVTEAKANTSPSYILCYE